MKGLRETINIPQEKQINSLNIFITVLTSKTRLLIPPKQKAFPNTKCYSHILGAGTRNIFSLLVIKIPTVVWTTSASNLTEDQKLMWQWGLMHFFNFHQLIWKTQTRNAVLLANISDLKSPQYCLFQNLVLPMPFFLAIL